MGEGRNWNNMYGTKLLDATALPEDHEGGPEDCYGGEKDAATPLEVHGYGGKEDGAAPLKDHDGDKDDRGAASKKSNRAVSKESNGFVLFGQRALQVLAIRANFPICTIYGYDGILGRCIYRQCEAEVQKEGMVNLVPIGPGSVLIAYGAFGLEVFPVGDTTTTSDEGSSRFGSSIREDCDVCGDPIRVEWDVGEDVDEEPEEYTRTICGGPGRMLEITYLVIPYAIETNVEVKLKLKDLGSRSHAVYGKIKVSATDYGNKSVHLFSYERRRSWSVPSGPTSFLPLSPSVIAVPYRGQLELYIEVDLTVITIFDNKEEDKNFKCSLKFARGIKTQEREVDDVQVEVNITYGQIWV